MSATTKVNGTPTLSSFGPQITLAAYPYPTYTLPSEPASPIAIRGRAEPVSSFSVPLAQAPSIDDIYRAMSVGSSELRTAVTLLKTALQWTDSALASLESAELIHADDAMQHVRALLPELFCCRRLGDGFGTVVNAAQSALENKHGEPLTENQIRSIRGALKSILDEPLIGFDAANKQVDRLESAGLSVDPSVMAAITAIG